MTAQLRATSYELLPCDLVPRSTSVLRIRLRRSWENLGKAIPPGFARWPRARLVAVWIRLWEEQPQMDADTRRSVEAGRSQA